MRWILGILFLGFWGTGFSFFLEPGLVVKKQVIKAEEKLDGVMGFEIFWSIENPTAKPKNAQLFFPFGIDVPQNLKISRNFEVSPVYKFSGKEKAEKAFELAKRFQNPEFFLWAEKSISEFIASDNWSIPAKTTENIVLKFDQKIHQTGDFSAWQLASPFVLKIQEFQVLFSFPLAPPTIFQSSLPLQDLNEGILWDSGTEINTKKESAKMFFWNNADLPKNSLFFWSKKKNPVFTFGDGKHSYKIQAGKRGMALPIKKVSILVDRSGSMGGAKWYATEKIIAKILDALPEEMEIQIVFWNTVAKNFFDPFLAKTSNGFYKNTKDFQRNVLRNISSSYPLGKSDIASIFPKIQEADLNILITDQKEDTMNFDAAVLENVKRPILVLGTEKNEILAYLAKKSGGKFFKIYENDPEISQMKLQIGNNAFHFRSTAEFPEETGLTFPLKDKAITENENPLFITRKDEPSVTESSLLSDFFREKWAEGALEGFWEKAWKGEKSAAEDFLRIKSDYGVQKKALESIKTSSDFWKKQAVIRKEKIPALAVQKIFTESSNNLFQKTSSDVLWDAKKRGFFTQDFVNRGKKTKDNAAGSQNFAKLLLQVAPFSVAQKELLAEFPDIFAKIFARGMGGDCTPRRCIEITKKGKEKLGESDKIWWNDSRTDWSDGIIFWALETGRISMEEVQNPQKKISRKRAVEILFQKKKYIPFREKIPYFTDISAENLLFPAVQTLVENGIVSLKRGEFLADTELTRAEALSLVLKARFGRKAVQQEKSKSSSFADAKDWQIPLVELAQRKRIIRGEVVDGKKVFRPNDAISLAEFLALWE